MVGGTNDFPRKKKVRRSQAHLFFFSPLLNGNIYGLNQLRNIIGFCPPDANINDVLKKVKILFLNFNFGHRFCLLQYRKVSYFKFLHVAVLCSCPYDVNESARDNNNV